MLKAVIQRLIMVAAVCGVVLNVTSASAQDSLTQRLLNYQTPLASSSKVDVIDTGEIQPSEIRKYKNIFELQRSANWQDADEIIAKLQDKRLIGYVLQQRYLHPTGYTSSYEELRAWMAKYSDHGDARRIYNLALKKKGAGTGRLKSPKSKDVTHRYIDLKKSARGLYSDGTRRSQTQKSAFIDISKEVRAKIKNERPTQALAILDKQRGRLTKLDYDRLRARIAASYMHEGKLRDAFGLARQAVQSSGAKVPLAAWVGGLSAWRSNRQGEAAKYFEIAASSQYANAWTKSGAAFWASRAHMRVGNFQAVSLWLNRAASEPRTFYGLIAIRSLSRPLPFDWTVPTLSKAQIKMLTKEPAAVRGLALLKLGRADLAEQEFRRFEQSESYALRRALISVANDIKSPGMSWRAASYLLKEGQGDIPIAAQYPLMRWNVDNAYKIEPALLHALIRQESKFNPRAGNPSGASGLMQLMPSTASGIMGEVAYEAAGGKAALFQPVVNMAAGQKYVHELFKRYVPDRNLFDMLIAWNAGPGNLQRWKRNLKNMDDPLLFIESIPVAETRAFVERVMTNYWLYQDRMGLKTPSLDAVAEGGKPIYTYK